MPSREDVVARHSQWKERPVRPSSVEVQASRAAVLKIAENLGQLMERALDLALGLTVVQVYDAQVGGYQEPSDEQALALATDPTLLPALASEGLARVYVRPPDPGMLRDLLNRGLGKAPTATERTIQEEQARLASQHQMLAEAIRNVVPPQYLAPIRAELQRLAGDD